MQDIKQKKEKMVNPLYIIIFLLVIGIALISISITKPENISTIEQSYTMCDINDNNNCIGIDNEGTSPRKYLAIIRPGTEYLGHVYVNGTYAYIYYH